MKENNVYLGLYYDEELTASTRFYVPIASNIVLYAGYYDASDIAGVYVGANSNNPVIKITADGTFEWRRNDNAFEIGTYWFDGIYFFMSVNETYEGWEVDYNLTNHTFSFYDANADYYSYEYKRVDTDALYGGRWEDSNGNCLEFDYDGTVLYSDGYSTFETKYTLDESNVTITPFEYYSSISGTLEDGKLTLIFDDGDYPFTLTFTREDDFVISFKDSKAIGSWHSNVTYYAGGYMNLEVKENGVADVMSPSGSIYCYGGYTQYGNTVILNTDNYNLKGNFIYNSSLDVMVKEDGAILLSKYEYTTSYKTENSSLIIYDYDGHLYVVSSGALVQNGKVEGNLAEGETINVYDGSDAIGTYTITDGVLVGEEPADFTKVAGEYEGTIGSISYDLNLTAEGTYTLSKGGDYTGNYNYDGSVVSFTYGGYVNVTLTYNSETQTLTGTADDGEYEMAASFTIKEEEEPQVSTFYGTWIATYASNRNTIVLNSDLSGTYNDISFTYTVTGSQIYFEVGDMEVTLTYNETGDSMSGQFEQDYETYYYTSIVRG